MEDKINFKELLEVLKKRLLMILSIAIGVLVLSVVYTFFIATPQYQATTQILINQTQDTDQSVNAVELQSNRELINTYNVIMTSPIILDRVIEETGVDKSVGELQNQITLSAENDSQVVMLTVEDNDPNIASNLANSIADTFEQEVTNIMNIDNVSILSESNASEITSPVSPQPFLNLSISLILGLILGVVIAYLKEFLDQTIRTENEVEKILKLPILGSISVIEQNMDNEQHSNLSRSKKNS